MHTERVEVEVEDCGLVHLFDEKYYEAADESDDSATRSLGEFVYIAGGIVNLSISLQWGDIPFTVTVADRDPGAGLDHYEDVVETSFESPSGQVCLMGWFIDWHGKSFAAFLRCLPVPAHTACGTTPEAWMKRATPWMTTTFRYGRHRNIRLSC